MILYYIILHHIILYCIVLYSIIQYNIVLPVDFLFRGINVDFVRHRQFFVQGHCPEVFAEFRDRHDQSSFACCHPSPRAGAPTYGRKSCSTLDGWTATGNINNGINYPSITYQLVRNFSHPLYGHEVGTGTSGLRESCHSSLRRVNVHKHRHATCSNRAW